MSTRNAFCNRKFLHSVRVTFASVALSLYCCAYAYPQSKSPDVAAELDTLLANKQYPQLERGADDGECSAISGIARFL